MDLFSPLFLRRVFSLSWPGPLTLLSLELSVSPRYNGFAMPPTLALREVTDFFSFARGVKQSIDGVGLVIVADILARLVTGLAFEPPNKAARSAMEEEMLLQGDRL